MSRILSITFCSCAITLSGCNRSQPKSADTTTSSQAGTVAAAPAQSLAQLAGTWHGITLAKDRDTTVGSWTFDMSGDTGTVTFPTGLKVPVRNFRVVGDTIMSKMGPWRSPTPESKGQPVTGDIVEQVRGDSVVGTVVSHLVSKPDSITAQVRIKGTRGKT